MKITSIYKKYPVPLLLQKHQLRAASVGKFLSENFKDKSLINQELIIKSLLVHDMGNIIKFDLSSSSKMMTEEEKKHIDYWRKQQEKYRKKYNNDDHLATIHIVNELNLQEEIKFILLHSGSSKLKEVIASSDFNAKVVTYSDLRCAPFEVVGIDKRFDDVVERYKNSSHPLSRPDEVESRRKLAHELEKQIKEQIKIDLNLINEKIINQTMEELINFEI